MATPPRTQEVMKQLYEFVCRSCFALFWYDNRVAAPQNLRGGSCFILRFDDRLVGVTANHVVEEYIKDRQTMAAPACQLWNMPLDLVERVIDRDADLDIATFSVSEVELRKSRGTCFDCTGGLPKQPPVKGDLLSIAGYPELGRRPDKPNQRADLEVYVGFPVVEDVTPREIVMTYDPKQAFSYSATAGLPPLRYNLSGCSGGPTLIYKREPLLTWRIGGLIVAGPGAEGQGEHNEFDLIRVRRIDFIKPDGKLTSGTQGWLP